MFYFVWHLSSNIIWFDAELLIVLWKEACTFQILIFIYYCIINLLYELKITLIFVFLNLGWGNKTYVVLVSNTVDVINHLIKTV